MGAYFVKCIIPKSGDNVERERKFLVEQRPDNLSRYEHSLIRQGYLAIANDRGGVPVEVRLRRNDGQYLLAVKGGQGHSRVEEEMSIPARRFNSLWPLTSGRRIEKVRYDIPLGGLTIELDLYRGKLRGLMTAEAEFDSDRRLREFNPPAWLGREITGIKKFSNSELALAKRPPSGDRAGREALRRAGRPFCRSPARLLDGMDIERA